MVIFKDLANCYLAGRIFKEEGIKGLHGYTKHALGYAINMATPPFSEEFSYFMYHEKSSWIFDESGERIRGYLKDKGYLLAAPGVSS